ncbi:hypothetical protein THASP1DRAFT_21680 [Thamnocephalis sphaerospora]|uniref:Uncharacterized protein n=1 Tax=Thamnocephalis sphaerospora TaxID=78915 RepID=A0A4P9XWD4_9FUNG|nr:hypothetical protein THASP1DRAFT_21680 [Thamnocephalis sphaerospora]|eukprot:RKP10643.1 hypothetical protein THASP1DRAFT_21680 [Thamnocephalis sphaerospora]
MDRQAASFSPYTDSYQASRPPTGKYQPIGSEGAESNQSANPFANAFYRSPDDAHNGNTAGGARINKYETSLPVRVDVEAALAYLLGCLTGVFFLIFEQKNDYVRFHAWQSCLVFGPMMVVQFIIGLISSVLGWLLFIANLAITGFLMYQAYRNGASLDRFLVPVAGGIAARWIDAE